MQIKITGNHVTITDAIRSHIEEKIKKIENHFNKISSVDFILNVKNHTQHKAECKIHVAGKDIFANHESNNMYNSIDRVVQKLDRQIIKYKEKLTSHS